MPTAQSLGHDLANEWSNDLVNHWHDCSRCDNEEKVAHTFGEDNVCMVCGYEKHEHPICGAACTHSGSENHGNIGYEPFPKGFTGGTLTTGNYYLTKNVDLTNTIIIDSGATVSICLNGNSIDAKNGCRVIEVKGTLNLTDCKATETDGAYTAGEIRNGKADDNGGGVYVDNKGTFHMHGGIIKDNKAENYGGGVYTNGAFSIQDGIIKNNTVTNGGGGVCASNGAFNMQGGSIENNTITNKNGGGVLVDGISTNITLIGGRIVNNTKNGNPNNIYLDNRKIKLEQTMAEDALFGITNTGAFADACDTDHSQYFFSDGGNKVVYTADKTLAVENTSYNLEIKGDMIISKSDGASILVVASYDEVGDLVDVKTFNIASGSIFNTIDGTGINTQNAKTVKAFLWESFNSIKPLVPCVEKTYTN